MKINVLYKSKNELRIEVVGEGHSFCNALQRFLLNDNSIDFAGYNISHPLISSPVIYVRTKGRRRPENALIDAAKTLSKNLNDIEKTLRRQLRLKEF